MPVLATESGKKRWEFRLSSVALPAFLRVCEDSVADSLRYAICPIASTGVRNASSISTATPSPVIASLVSRFMIKPSMGKTGEWGPLKAPSRKMANRSGDARWGILPIGCISRRQHRRPQTHAPRGHAKLMDLGTSARHGAVCVASILFDRGVAGRGVCLSMTMMAESAIHSAQAPDIAGV